MNKVDEILLKYGFTKSIVEDNNLDEISEELNENIARFMSKSNKKYMDIKYEEIKIINDILDIGSNSVVNRSNYNMNDLFKDELYIGKSSPKLKNIKEKLTISVRNQNKKEEKLISSIKKDLGKFMFKELEHELLSDEFLEYMMD